MLVFQEENKKKKEFQYAKFFRSNWKVLLMVTLPAVLSPMLILGSKPTQCGFIIIVVAIYWLTEVMHLAVSSLIPIVLMPMFEILEPKEVAACYMKDITFMLIGGLIVAKAIEKQNLHKRLALNILRMMGPNPVFQYFGFMYSTWFISMWISNSSTTAMMITIASAVNEQWIFLHTGKGVSMSEDLSDRVVQVADEDIDSNISSYEYSEDLEDEEVKRVRSMGKGLLLSIAYSATCGGMATIPGTPPNLVFYAMMESRYGSKLKLNFASFMLFSLPMSFVIIFICWMLLLYRFVGIQNSFQRKVDPVKDKKLMESIQTEIENLGTIKYGEVTTLVVFVFLILLWILKDPGYPLLSKLFTYKIKGKPQKFWSDGISAILASLFVFNLSAYNPFNTPPEKYDEKLIDWGYLEKGFQWGIVFIFGGGFALAAGCEKSGLSKIIGIALRYFMSLPHYSLLLFISFGISILTEFTSNVVTASILLPILLEMAECIDMHPLRMGLTVTLSCSLSFCLPAATPANAIVINTGKVQVIDMVTTGLMLNFICIFILSLTTYYYSCPIFTTDVFPEWIKTNCSSKQ